MNTTQTMTAHDIDWILEGTSWTGYGYANEVLEVQQAHGEKGATYRGRKYASLRTAMRAAARRSLEAACW